MGNFLKMKQPKRSFTIKGRARRKKYKCNTCDGNRSVKTRVIRRLALNSYIKFNEKEVSYICCVRAREMGTLEVDKSLKAAFKETLEPHGFKKVKGGIRTL